MQDVQIHKDQIKGQERNQPDHVHETYAITTIDPLPPPPSSSAPNPPFSTASPPPKTPLSPPLDSPLHSSRSSDQSPLSHLSSPHEKPPSLPLSPVPLPTIVGGAKPQYGEVQFHAQEDGRRGGESSGGVGDVGARPRPSSSALGKARGNNSWRKALLGSRILGFLFCLISFSVLAADKNKGWALDSFHRYKEFRYCMTVNVIGFAYSVLQVYDLAYTLATGKRLVGNKFRYLIDFSLDQMLAYLILSASSSANFRIDDWESNWGKDKFPTMARASLAFSYLAFLAFASCSLLSGYSLLAHKSR